MTVEIKGEAVSCPTPVARVVASPAYLAELQRSIGLTASDETVLIDPEDLEDCDMTEQEEEKLLGPPDGNS